MTITTNFRYETLIKELNNNPNTISKDICSKCKGRCCKNGGCDLAPNHFGVELTEEFVIEQLKTGLYTISWWDAFWGSNENFSGDEGCDVFHLRMRQRGEHAFYKRCGADRWSGTCVALTEKGCPFSNEERPLGGLSLIPQMKDDKIGCYGMYECEDIAKDWLDSGYHHILRNVVEMFVRGEIKTNERFMEAFHLSNKNEDYFELSYDSICRENNPLTYFNYDIAQHVHDWI